MEALSDWGLGQVELDALARLPEGARGTPGRVVSEHKGGLFVRTAEAERHAIVPGRLRRAAERGLAVLPTVGDFVSIGTEQGTGAVPVLAVLPRRTVLQRRAAGERDAVQTLAANIDIVLLVAALTRDLNPRRLERAMAITRESLAEPIVVLTKSDLGGDVEALRAQIADLVKGAQVFSVSARTGEGLPALEAALRSGSTSVLLGSSGVGKSTLVNRWLGRAALATAEVDAEGKGKHTTTHRELVRLPWGALVVDTPGLRELGLWEAEEGLREVFDDLDALGETCRFRDCAHESEPGCAIRAASESGAVLPARYEAFLNLRRELAALGKRKDARARAESKAADKISQRAMNELKRDK